MSLSFSLSSFIDAAKRADSNSYISICPFGVNAFPLPKKSFFQSRFSEQELEINRKTWEAFKHTVLNELGPDRFQRMQKRYDIQFDQQRDRGLPLTAKHIWMAGVISADALTTDLKRNFGGDKLKFQSTSEILRRIQHLDKMRFTGPVLDPARIYGGPSERKAFFFHDQLLVDRERLALLQGETSSLHPLASIERFAKATVNKEFKEKMIVPFKDAHGNTKLFKVYKKVATGHGLVAYALRPLGNDSGLNSFIIFRPSQFAPSGEDFVETWINDGQLKFGKWGYAAARRTLMHLMNDPKFCPRGQKVDVAGFSLAGGYVQRFLVDHALRVKNAYFFNNPSIDNDPAEEFANRMNCLPPLNEPIHFHIFRTKGDRAHFLGEKHIGWGVDNNDIQIRVTEIDPEPNLNLSSTYRHSYRFFDQIQKQYTEKTFVGNEAQKELDNHTRGDDIWWHEAIRRWYPVRIFYGCMCISYWFYKMFSSIFRFKIFRSSAP